MKRIIISIMLMCLFTLFFSCSAYATNTPFEYNIIPQVKNLSTIDTKATKTLSFKLYEYQDDIYFNDKKVNIKDNSFSIDVSKLSGKKDIIFKNSNNEQSKFTYYFSDKSGKLDEYVLVAGKDLNVYITTYRNISIIYTDKEKSALAKLKTNISKMPQKMIDTLSLIKMIPYSNTSNIAGTTKDSQITLYNYTKYDNVTQKNIIFHEATHSFANSLMDKKVIDYDYTDYNEIMKKDNNYVSKYSKNFADNHDGRLSEDFADAFAFYLINQKEFQKSYPARYNYIKTLLK